LGTSPGAKDAVRTRYWAQRLCSLAERDGSAKSLKGNIIMHMSTLIVLIVLGVLLFGGGGGYYWSRRR
jgi:hypothetical protein